MIDINKMRRLAQAATPGPWVAAGPSFGESLPKYLNEVAVDREGDEDDGYSICNAPIGLNEECSDDMAFIAEANPLTIEELLDRLEAAEADALEQARLNGMGSEREAALMAKLEAAEKERDALRAENEALAVNLRGKHSTTGATYAHLIEDRDALRAKIAEMEKQEPVAWGAFYFGGKLNGKLYSQCDTEAQIDMYIADRHQSDDSNTFRKAPLYALPGAQPVPSEPVVTPKMEQAFYEKVEITTVGSIRGLADGIKAAMLAATPEAKA